MYIIQDSLKDITTDITLFSGPWIINFKPGTKQGDTCFTKANAIVMEKVEDTVQMEARFFLEGEVLQLLLFVDDIVLIASTPKTL